MIFDICEKVIKVDLVYRCCKSGYGRKVVFGQQTRKTYWTIVLNEDETVLDDQSHVIHPRLPVLGWRSAVVVHDLIISRMSYELGDGCGSFGGYHCRCVRLLVDDKNILLRFGG